MARTLKGNKKRPMSKAGREHISRAQTARWKQYRKDKAATEKAAKAAKKQRKAA